MTSDGTALALRGSHREPEMFGEFYRYHFEPVLAFLARRVYDPELALDLTGETFAQAFMSRRRFRGTTDAEAEAWIYRIARHQLSRYFRRGKVERRAMKRLEIEIPRLDAERLARIEELADVDGLRSALRVELARLPDPQREAVRLRILEEHSYAEIAGRLRISEQAARARVSRGLRSLAAALEGKPTIEELRA